jgi:hypothetical protein
MSDIIVYAVAFFISMLGVCLLALTVGAVREIFK